MTSITLTIKHNNTQCTKTVDLQRQEDFNEENVRRIGKNLTSAMLEEFSLHTGEYARFNKNYTTNPKG